MTEQEELELLSLYVDWDEYYEYPNFDWKHDIFDNYIPTTEEDNSADVGESST